MASKKTPPMIPAFAAVDLAAVYGAERIARLVRGSAAPAVCDEYSGAQVDDASAASEKELG